MEKPILFNTDMVLAILDGRKTVTRRLIKPQPETFGKALSWKNGIYSHTSLFKYAPCQIGDILYVRETYGFDKNNWIYKADFSVADLEKIKNITKWRPSIHMPKQAARIWLKATNVRLERLQDITNEQILAEGANKDRISSYIRQMAEDTEEWTRAAYLLEWSNLWDATVKADWQKWENNPWVWVIEFERCDKPEQDGAE